MPGMARIWLIAVMLASLGAAQAVAAAPVTKLRITNGEWPPYLSRDLPYAGVASRIVSEAFASQGIQVEYGFFPWNRAFQLANSGEWDGTAVWLDSAERRASFYLSDPVVEARYVFFYRKGRAFDWKSLQDLKRLRIGATLEYDYGADFEAMEKKGLLHVEREPSDEQNFARLLAGRIDIFPMDQEVGLAMLRKRFSASEAARLTTHPIALRTDALRLLLTRQHAANAEYIVRFNKGLKLLRDSGKIRRYIDESRVETRVPPVQGR